jgi:GT2 family glycosyltransferase
MTNSPKVSLIIPVFNQTTVLLDTLTCLRRQSYPAKDFEVIVVDDGSAEDLHFPIAHLELPFHYSIIRTENRGPAAARNLGAKHAKAEILLFLDADMLAVPNLLEAHLQAQEIHPRALVIGLRKIHLTPRTPLFMQIIDVDTNPRRTPIDFPEILTSNLSLTKTAFMEIGGFDEQLMRWEDVEFGYRAKQAGFDLVFLPEAVAYHEHPISFRQFCEKQKKHHRLSWLFFNLHPDVLNSFDYLSDKLPVDISKDTFRLIIKKNIRRLLASPLLLAIMKQSIILL